jgi:tetrahydromethanopterin S-methyltransferase subunit H
VLWVWEDQCRQATETPVGHKGGMKDGEYWGVGAGSVQYALHDEVEDADEK